LATLPIGSDAHITFLRDGIEKSTDIHLLPPPENPPRDTSEIKGRNPLAGATIANINPALAEEKGIPPESRGVIVMETRPGSTADRYGFQPLDLLLAVNDKPLASVADAKALLNAPVPGWRIKINREGQTLSLTVNQ
jgi:serine protease Do